MAAFRAFPIPAESSWLAYSEVLSSAALIAASNPALPTFAVSSSVPANTPMSATSPFSLPKPRRETFFWSAPIADAPASVFDLESLAASSSAACAASCSAANLFSFTVAIFSSALADFCREVFAVCWRAIPSLANVSCFFEVSDKPAMPELACSIPLDILPTSLDIDLMPPDIEDMLSDIDFA